MYPYGSIPHNKNYHPAIFGLLLGLFLVCLPDFIANANEENRLTNYQISENRIIEPLTNSPGDPFRGRKVVAGRDGNCLACHKAPIPEEQFHGNLGPDLSQVASYYDASQLRLRIVDPKKLNPETIMPSFYKISGLNRVGKRYANKPMLNAQQIEDVISYLLTLQDNEP